jgi:plastocyanin
MAIKFVDGSLMKHITSYVLIALCLVIGTLISCSNAPSQPDQSIPQEVASVNSSSSRLAVNARPSITSRLAASSTNSQKKLSLQKIENQQGSSLMQKNFSASSHARVVSSAAAVVLVSKAASATVSGIVKIAGKNGEVLSAENSIVNLEPVTKTLQPASVKPKAERSISMINKSYSPNVITITRNETVKFSNRDKIKHNVFSTSGANSFDLGTYGEGVENKVPLKALGIVKVYCNIHPEMVSIISVSDYDYSFIVGKDGAFSIGDLPAGEYSLSAWNIRGELQKIIKVESGKNMKLDLQIDAASYVPAKHKNKYGEEYKVKSALFDDEFY